MERFGCTCVGFLADYSGCLPRSGVVSIKEQTLDQILTAPAITLNCSAYSLFEELALDRNHELDYATGSSIQGPGAKTLNPEP